jgi:SNF2 family DNA or RNA helicase
MPKRLWVMGLGPSKDGENDVIWVRTDVYDPDANAALKSELPGPPRFNRDKGRWEFPVHWDTCTGARRVATKFGAELKMSKTLVEWAQVEKARQETIPDVQSMDLVDLPAISSDYPTIWEAMSARPFQTVGAAFAARNRSCLIADQPGLGKTVQSIAAIIESGITGPILVVAPKAASQLTWPQELARWVPDDIVYVLGADVKASERAAFVASAASYASDNEANERVWLITSPVYVRIKAKVDEYNHYVYENGHKVINPVGSAVMELFDTDWSAIIVDESHQTLAGATGNKKKQSGQRLGLGALSVREDGLRIALSGTPFRGKEQYLWGQLNWLRPDLYRGFWPWVKKHFDVFQDRYGWTVGAMVDREGMYAEAKSVMIRRTKSEVAKDLPPKMYGGWPLDSRVKNSPVAVWLPMESKQAKAYADIQRHAAAELEGGTLLTNGILAELTRLKQFAGSYGKMVGDHFVPTLPSNKFDWLVEMLDERGIAKDSDVPMADRPKVVVASQFSQLIDCFGSGLSELGIRGFKFTGGTSDKERERIKDDWQNNPDSEHRVLLLTTTAGGVSLTLDAADELVLLDETWSASDQEQVEDRLHRLSRIHQVTIWHVKSLNTIDEAIARANLAREVSIKSIIDGERGIEFARTLFDAS